MGQFVKPFEELCFSDNFIFCKVMQDESICKQMLKILLKIDVDHIEYLNTEHPLENFYDTKGVRMDVFLKDSNRVIDIEIQTGNYDDLLLRARYYQGAADINTVPRRTKYKDLKENFILFICKDDPFGLGFPCYTKKTSFVETDDIPYDDKTHNVFYNSSAYAKAHDKEVRDVLEFIYTMKSNSDFTKYLETSVKIAKAKPVFKDEYMYFSDIVEDEKEKAYENGHKDGQEEGKRSVIIEQIKKKLAKNKNPEQISDELELSLQETLLLIEQVKQ